jgi:hypothetical protein
MLPPPFHLRRDFQDGNLYSVVAKRFSEISFSPLHVKGNNGFFDGHRTSPLVSFAPPLTLPLGGERCEKFGIFPLTLPSPARGEGEQIKIKKKLPPP